ncbi:dihydrofolate reductase [Membranihabitans marinus]|uniref:dihydrofolate reductase n=1 Tax=Membranihabitans marinus TaxID=1227546 RepID=UPI001F31B8DE|nr:dihydrofolate reductase [Membranihabitans marinus]
MIISAIVAISTNNVIGHNNQLPWYLPADLKYFKKTTINHPVIMGRKSFESIGRPLPKRQNIVITKNPFYIANGISVAHSLEESIDIARESDSDEVFVIGGAEIFNLALPFCQRIYLTRVHGEIEGNIYFPEWDENEWRLIANDAHPPDEKNEYGYTFMIYERI